jgi:hypothetical protein
MPAGAKGFKPGPSARRFLWSIGEEEDDDDGEGRRTIVWGIGNVGSGGRSEEGEEGGVGDHIFAQQKSRIGDEQDDEDERSKP